MCLSFLGGAVTIYHKLGGLKPQKVILSQFWRLDVRNQGVNSVGSFGRLCAGICSMRLS